jgi:hypothetical protein
MERQAHWWIKEEEEWTGRTYATCNVFVSLTIDHHSDSTSASYNSCSRRLKTEKGGGKKSIYHGGCDDTQDGMNFDLIL